MSIKDPKLVKYAFEDVGWSKTMEEETEQFQKNKTWTLVSRPKDKKCDWHQVGI